MALGSSSSVSAQQPAMDGSAQVKITGTQSESKEDMRIKKLEHFLSSYNSPLTPHSELIVTLSDAYDIPWTLVPAISGVESGFCHHIPIGSSNCWGWNNGKSAFEDLSQAIYIVSKTIKYSYFDRGLDTPFKMSHVYAPPSSTWGGKVSFFMNKIENIKMDETPSIDL